MKAFIQHYPDARVYAIDIVDGNFCDPRVFSLFADVLDYQQLESALQQCEADILVHTVALYRSVGDEHVVRNVIVNGTKNALQVAQKLNIPKVY